MTNNTRYLGQHIGQLCGQPIQGLALVLADNKAPESTHLRHQIDRLIRFGLGHLTLDTAVSHLSTGEWQRARLCALSTQQLTGLLLIVDEPMSGLGQKESAAVVDSLRELTDKGNTVVIILHWLPLLSHVDWIIEIGPKAGKQGGDLLFSGTYRDFCAVDTATARAVNSPTIMPIISTLTQPTAGKLLVISGPSGSGKTRRLRELADNSAKTFSQIIHLNPYAGSNTKRSTPATLIGLWTTMRDLLAKTKSAKVLGLSASDFSLNRPGGRCETCQGEGTVRIDLGPLPPIFQTCTTCDGTRFNENVRAVTWHGIGPDQLLDLTATDALARLAGHSVLERQLRAMVAVGLGYLTLGQPAHSWSTGESRRLRIARTLVQLGRQHDQPSALFIDDPTAGLHPDDTTELMATLAQITKLGHALVITTHNPSVVAQADGYLQMDAVP